jgi:SAM-dependent methyltransferase
LDLIQKRKEAGTILDVGTGCGFFLVEASKRGWQTKGIDPSKKSIEIAKKTNHLDVFNGTLREYDEKGLFDVITFINALDHSPEPWKEIEWAKQRLSAGGLIYIRFPSGDLHTKIFNLFTYLGLSKRIQNYVVFHEFVLTKRFLARLLSDQGFAKISFYSSPCAGGESCNFASNKFVNFCCKVLLCLLTLVKKIPGIKPILFSTTLDVIGAKY